MSKSNVVYVSSTSSLKFYINSAQHFNISVENKEGERVDNFGYFSSKEEALNCIKTICGNFFIQLE